MARQNTSSSNNSGQPAAAPSYNAPATNLPQPAASSHQYSQPLQHQSYPPTTSQPVNMPSLPFSLPQLGTNNHAQPPSMPPMNSNAALNPYAMGNPSAPGGASGSGGAALDSNVQQQIMLIKALADQGVPFEKIPALLQSMSNANPTAPAAGLPSFQPPVPAAQGTFSTGQQQWGAPAPGAGDMHDRQYQDSGRSPRYGRRSRSRSPDRGWQGRDSPHGRDRGGQGRYDDRDRRGGNDYRQRSPDRRGRSPTPEGEFPHIERWIEFDSSLPTNSIRVLSRTLFVGGVT